MTKIKPLHLNVPQALTNMVQATKSYHVWGRGTGKTTGVLAPWYLRNMQQMPRGQHGVIGRTYQQLLTRTLPPVFQMWERMGYKQGEHFIFGKEPSDVWKKRWNWEPPFTKPLKSEYTIYWYNGAINVMISQDRPGSANGISLDSLGGDEAKLLIKERLDEEVIPALRGNRSVFGHLPCYRSECYTTDMPTTPKAKWILDMAEQMDQEQIDLILHLQIMLELRRKAWRQANSNEKHKIERRIKTLEKELNKMRMPRKIGPDEWKYSVYYSTASAADNKDVLGPEYLSDMRRILSDVKYRTSILNEQLMKVEEGFYGNLDPDVHGTDWFNYHYLDTFTDDIHNPKLQELDSRQDEGYIASRPLDIAFDYGDKINCAVVGQEVKDEYRFLKSFYVLHPELVDAVVTQFCKYYQHYPTKVVNYYYDHTAMPGSGVTDFNYYQRVIEAFKRNGWHVNDIYTGQAPPHEVKFEFINLMLREAEEDLPKLRYSRTHCAQWELSALNAGLKQTPRGFRKDKSPERDKNVKPEEATHLSDAGDTLLFRFHNRIDDSSTYIPAV